MRTAVVLVFVLTAPLAAAADSIPAAQAKDHVGQTATVCGTVAGTRYLDSGERKPTFLNFEKPYPNHPFTAVIFGEDRAKFGKPEETYLNKSICVTGEIKDYNGKPEVILTEPA
jgi:hypothetical protein